MIELIDLSQEIFAGMSVFPGMPPVTIEVHATHEEWDRDPDPTTRTPSAPRLSLGDHTGTHVDALSHMGRAHAEKSIDRMPLSMFYTEAVCLDLSHTALEQIIEADDLEEAVRSAAVTINPGDTVLIHTDHYRRAYGTPDWPRGPGLSAAAARWLGEQRVAAFGVETMSPGVPGVSNRDVHRICGKLGFTHYENLVNLHRLVGRGRFRFIGLPLKIRGATASPVRAIAVIGREKIDDDQRADSEPIKVSR